MTDSTQARPARDLVHEPRITRRPGRLSRFVFDQVLTNFDQRMRKPARRAVPVETVVFETARVRLVVADDETGFGAKTRDQQHGARSSRSHRMPVCQARARPRHEGVKLCTDRTTGTTPASSARVSAAAIAA